MPHRPSSLAGAWDAEAAGRPHPRQASGPLHEPTPYHDPEAPSAPPLPTRTHDHSTGGALARYPAIPAAPPQPSRAPSVTALLARDPSRRTTMPNLLPTVSSYTSANPLPTIHDAYSAAYDQGQSWEDHQNPSQQQRQTRTALPGAAASSGGAGTDGGASGSTAPPVSVGVAPGPSARWSKPPLPHYSAGGAAFSGQHAASISSGQGGGAAAGRTASFRTAGGAPPAAYVTRAASATTGGALGRSAGGGLTPVGEVPGLTALSAASLNSTTDAVAPRNDQQQQQDRSGGRPTAPATLPYAAPVLQGPRYGAAGAVPGVPVQGMSTTDPRDGGAGPPGLGPGVAIGVPVAEGVASGMAEGVPVPVPLALGAGGLSDADVVATIEVSSGRGRRAGSRMSSSGGGGGVTDVEEMAAAEEGGEGGGGEGEGPPAVLLPAEVRRRLKGHLGRHRMKSVRTWTHLSHCMARPRSGYWVVGTMLLLSVLLGAFLFMGAQYEFVRAAEEAAEAAAAAAKAAGGTAAGEPFTGLITLNGTVLGAVGNAAPAPAAITPPATGPRALGLWLSFWRNSPARTLSFSYLRTWGGRYAPDVAAGQWWRWVTGLLLHASPMHLVANLALLLVLSTYLETMYGFWRLLPVWLAAGLAGNFASALLEAPCTLVVGASGCVFGLLGMYCADAALNWESIPLLWLRLGGVAGVVAFTVALQVTDSDHLSHGLGGVSHASHVAGFLAGALLALAVLPDFKARRAARVVRLLQSLGVADHLPARRSPGGAQLYSFWQRHAWLTYCMYGISAAFLLAVLLAAPLVLYLHTFKRMQCDA